MKKIFFTWITLGLLLMSVPTIMAGGDKNRGEIGQGDTHEIGCENQPCFSDAPQPGSSSVFYESAVDPAATLDSAEIEDLLFIREEEKLARDVYIVLSGLYDMPIFANIAASEQRHMDAIKGLLDFYGIPDPVTDDKVGAFTDPDIESLFGILTGPGAMSEIDALLVGGFIEEYDISDIWNAKDATDEARIQRVYQNLCEGSYNHLNAFVYNYEWLKGEYYEPLYLTPDDYAEVMLFITQAKQAQTPKQRKGQ